MTINANTPDEYVRKVPDDRREAIAALRKTVNHSLPKGFQETINYGMIGWVVPHSTYPDGYHCDPKLPLPFMSLASQKNFIALYHSGLYADKDLYDWFVTEYPKHAKRKLDMGKSCIRFKKMDDIPLDLIGSLCGKISVNDWIALYETNVKKR